jgi:SAM-dependent methyltransferase
MSSWPPSSDSNPILVEASISEKSGRAHRRGFDRIWARCEGTDFDSGDDPQGFAAFKAFFSAFPLDRLRHAEGFELGCGSGRIAKFVAPNVGLLHCIDPSSAGLAASRIAMARFGNVRFHQASVDAIPLPDGSQDFGYSVGVIHHVPDPQAGLRSCTDKLKQGAPFLLYVYYRFDNRPAWFRTIWRVSDLARKRISRFPFPLRSALSTALAATAYWPLSRTARLLEKMGRPVDNFPLSFYRNHDWATLRSDALDRFGTAVEHRFTRTEIEAMMVGAGLRDIHFAEGPPFWIAVGYKRHPTAEYG